MDDVDNETNSFLWELGLNESDWLNNSTEQVTTIPVDFHVAHTFFILLIFMVIFGNLVVLFAVLFDRKLRTVTTNKFIASLAVSDLLVGIVVMPLSLHAKTHNDTWTLGYTWCQFHLVTGVFSTTASIVHLVAISLDRYFAIMFPTEYQRHSVSTSTLPYVVMIWIMALAVSSTLFMEQAPVDQAVCWIDNPQYIVLSSFLSFFLPGAIVVYMYVKIFKKLRNHQLYMFGVQSSRPNDKRRSTLPRVIIEEVRSRRGSRLSQSGSGGGSPTRRTSGPKNERSPSQPEIHSVTMMPQRWRSPTICAETFAHDRSVAAKKRVSIVPDPPSMEISAAVNYGALRDEHESARLREEEEVESRKNSEERLRKLSEEARMKRDRIRRESTDEKPNGVPIMVAFNKAFSEVRAGRRRSSLCRNDSDSGQHHLPIKMQLSTVYADEEESAGDAASVIHAETSFETATIVDDDKTLIEMSKDESAHDSLSTDTSLRPLLSAPPPLNLPQQPRPSKDFSVRAPAITNRLTPRSLMSRLRFLEPSASTSKCKEKHSVSSIFRCQSRIPPPTFLMVPAVMSINTPPLSPTVTQKAPQTLMVPRPFDCPSPTCGSAPSNSSHSSYTSASGSSDTYRRISMNSYGSSLTDATDSTFEIDSRRSSAWSTLRSAVLSNDFKGYVRTPVEISIEGTLHKKGSAISRGKLRRIATQVTRAIRRKRRESLAIRRESRATRVVAAILMAFLFCWLPYFIVSVYRGVFTGFGIEISKKLHVQLFVATSWLGYAHSCFNPVIYMCLNKNFRATLRKMFRVQKEE